MSNFLTPQARMARAQHDLRIGLPILLGDGLLVAAVETLDAAGFAGICALGPPDLVLSAARAETLKARVYSGDHARIALPLGAVLRWLHASADPAADLNYPMKGPYQSRRDNPDAAGCRAALTLLRRAHLLPAALVLRLDAPPAGLTMLSLDEIAQAAAPQLREVAGARVPLHVSAAGRVLVFRDDHGDEEHYAVEIGAPDRAKPVLARLHSACFTGDVIGSQKCDCGAQLQAALAAIGQAGAGVLLYLNQEGRGIGLANKMRAYGLQDQGFDTVEANHRLGFADDERDFTIGAQILRKMGFRAVRLMTNNPAKVARMNSCGLNVVERVPLAVGRTVENSGYLDTKAAKSGHLL
tara:strand:- start:861 stop:1922 length:1062 start_codon:yes stop_codon:yes gene_type:complete